DDGFIVGNHALDAEGVLEDGGKIAQRVHHQSGTGPQDDEAHYALDRALNALGHGFLLGNQADERDQADQHGRLGQHVKHQKIEKFHGQLQSDGRGGPQAAKSGGQRAPSSRRAMESFSFMAALSTMLSRDTSRPLTPMLMSCSAMSRVATNISAVSLPAEARSL